MGLQMRLVALLLARGALGIVHDEHHQAHLTVERLKALPEALPYVVLIHSGRCGTCIGFQPVWQQVLGTCKVDAEIQWGEFDVDQPRSGPVLQPLDLDVFPTVVVFDKKLPGGFKAAWSYPDDGPDDSSLYPAQPVCDAILRWEPRVALPSAPLPQLRSGEKSEAAIGSGLETSFSLMRRLADFGGGLLLLPIAAVAGMLVPCVANVVRRQCRAKPP